MISGKIAGENAAKPKDQEVELDAVTGASKVADLKSDAHTMMANFDAGKNQGIGISSNGISDLPIVVRVTLNDKNQLKRLKLCNRKNHHH